MKNLLTLLVLITSFKAFADCRGEAQIIAKVKAVESISTNTCHVSISEIFLFNDNGTCPLGIDTALSYGVELSLKDQHTCALQAGEILTGVLVLGDDSQIHLE